MIFPFLVCFSLLQCQVSLLGLCLALQLHRDARVVSHLHLVGNIKQAEKEEPFLRGTLAKFFFTGRMRGISVLHRWRHFHAEEQGLRNVPGVVCIKSRSKGRLGSSDPNVPGMQEQSHSEFCFNLFPDYKLEQ